MAAQSRYTIVTRKFQSARPSPWKRARGRSNIEEAAGGQLLAQDRPVVALEQLDELVEGAPAHAVVVRDGDRAGHGLSLGRGGRQRSR
jgi:hypothetical protein